MEFKEKNIHPDKKFIETFTYADGASEWEIETDTGWHDVKAVGKTVPYVVWELTLDNSTVLRCADTHIVFKTDGAFASETFVCDLKPGDNVLVTEGTASVVNVINTGVEEHMYDISIDNEEKRFYTDGVLSHNSIWLANLAARSVRLGYNTAVISLEMQDRKVIKRLGANLIGVSMREYADFSRDPDLVSKRLNNLRSQVEGLSLQPPGELFVKEFPTSAASVPDLEQYLCKMEELKGIKFKIVVIDYVNILKNWRNPNTENTYMKIKQIAEDLRAMAIRNRWQVVSATQVNRCLDLDTIVEEETKGKIKISEIVEGDKVLTPTGFSTVGRVWPITKQCVYKITLESGKSIICSENHIHPAACEMGTYFSAKNTLTSELSVGDFLFTKGELDNCVSERVDSIEKLDIRDTIDISLTDKDRVFFANDILTHNSGMETTDLGMTNVSESAALIHTVDAMFGIIQDETLHANLEYILKLIANRDDGYKNSKQRFKINYDYMRIEQDADSDIVLDGGF